MSEFPGFYDGGDDDDDVLVDEVEELTFDRINDFLRELKELSLRHKIQIAGRTPLDPFLAHLEATDGYYFCDSDGEGIGFIYGTAIQ